MNVSTQESSNREIDKRSSASPRRFSTNVALTLGTRLLMLASGLGASIIVARWLGAEGVGTLAVLNVTVALVVQLACAGLPSANTYFISQDRSRLAPVWCNALLFGLAAGTALTVVIILLAKLWPSLFGQVRIALVTIAAISIPFQLIILLGLNVLLALDEIDRLNLMDAAGQLLLFLNAIVAIGLIGAGLTVLVSLNSAVALLVSVVVMLMIATIISRTAEGGHWRPDWGLFKKMLRYGLKFHIAAVAAIVILRADLLLVNHFRGAREAGVYAVAAQMGSLMLLLPAVIATLLFPRVASESDARAALTMRATRHTAFIMLIVCSLAIPLSFALPLVYGAAFHDATILLLILVPGVYLIGIEAVIVQHFTGTGLPIAIPLFWIVVLCVNVGLNLIFIPIYGARAAALTSTISYALIFALVASYFRSQTGHHLSTVLLLRPYEFRDLLALTRLGFFSS
jgi:O-antigen/teichoic acid export membrane protein